MARALHTDRLRGGGVHPELPLRGPTYRCRAHHEPVMTVAHTSLRRPAAPSAAASCGTRPQHPLREGDAGEDRGAGHDAEAGIE